MSRERAARRLARLCEVESRLARLDRGRIAAAQAGRLDLAGKLSSLANAYAPAAATGAEEVPLPAAALKSAEYQRSRLERSRVRTLQEAAGLEDALRNAAGRCSAAEAKAEAALKLAERLKKENAEREERRMEDARPPGTRRF